MRVPTDLLLVRYNIAINNFLGGGRLDGSCTSLFFMMFFLGAV